VNIGVKTPPQQRAAENTRTTLEHLWHRKTGVKDGVNVDVNRYTIALAQTPPRISSLRVCPCALCILTVCVSVVCAESEAGASQR